MKSSALPQMKLNPPIRRRGGWVDLVEKKTCRNTSFFLSMGYKKDIFGIIAYEFELLQF